LKATEDNVLAEFSPTKRRVWLSVLFFVGFSVAGICLVRWSKPQVQPKALSELKSNLSQREGRLFAPGATMPYTGWMMDQYPDATLRSRSWISNGILHGVSEGWFTNGVRQVQEHFSNGISEGVITKWYPNGSKLSEGVARAGKLEGVFRRWHENGQLAEEVTFSGGQPDGLSRAWYSSGNLKAEVTMNAGAVLSQKFFKEGELPVVTSFVKGGGDR